MNNIDYKNEKYRIINHHTSCTPFFNSFANAQTEKLDNLATCAGVVIGNGSVDFYMGNEQSFDDAANIAYTAYLSEVFTGGYGQNDLEAEDQILGGNADAI